MQTNAPENYFACQCKIIETHVFGTVLASGKCRLCI